MSEEQPNESMPTGSIEVGQKNAVEVFVNTLEKAARSLRVYQNDSGPTKTLENIYRNLSNAFQRAFDDSGVIEVQVRATQMIYERKVIYENKDPRHSLSKVLYEAGIRMMSFKPGLTTDELVELIHILATDFTKVENQDADLYSLLKERSFSNFEILTEDRLDDLLKSDQDLHKRIQIFSHQSRRKLQDRVVSEVRRHRSDDLKILNEFQLKPGVFLKTDEEVSKIVKTLASNPSHEAKERETMERLALMGFHFLTQDEDRTQMQVGRELIVEVTKMMMTVTGIDLLRAIVQKLIQVQQDHDALRGEVQKVIDSVFHVDRHAKFASLLRESPQADSIMELLKLAPPVGSRLMILLLGDHPQVSKVLGPIIVRNLGEAASWINQEAEQSPDRPCWELLVNLLSKNPNAYLSKFLNTLLKSSSEALRSKVLRQCAEIGTRESLEIFKKMLESSKREDRVSAYRELSHSRSKFALQMVIDHITHPSFGAGDEKEQEQAFSSVMLMAGAASWPWFEKMWNQIPGGLFKSKAQTQRRLLLIRSASHGRCQEFLKKILESQPLNSFPAELQEALNRATQHEKSPAEAKT